MASDRVDSVLSALGAASSVRVHGLTPSAASWLLTRACLTKPRSGTTPRVFVLICPNDDIARERLADFETFSQIRAELFPTWDTSPYSPILPSLRTRLQRLAALCALEKIKHATGATADAEDPGPLAIFTSLAALKQATLPPAVFHRFSRVIQVGDSVGSREKFVTSLLEAGYARVDPVEDPGTFAVRGEIIDVFPPGAPHPLRIELFDDTVERVRTFDAQSQRTATDEAPGPWFIPPARELLNNSETAAHLREKIKAFADDRGIPRQVRDPVLEAVTAGLYPEGSEAWVPFAYAQQATLLDYLPTAAPGAPHPPCVLARWDQISIDQEFDQFFTEQERLASESSRIAPPPSVLFSGPDGLSFMGATQLHLDRIDLAPTDTPEANPAGKEADLDADSPDEPDRTRFRVHILPNPAGSDSIRNSLEEKFTLWNEQGYEIRCYAHTQTQLDRARFLLDSKNIATHAIQFHQGDLTEGFRWPAEKLAVLNESDLLGTRKSGRASRAGHEGSAAKNWAGLQNLADLSVGDTVVHVDHGIGRYMGLSRMDITGAASDFIQLEYANKDKLYVPVYRLNVVQKYVGGDAAVLDRLGAGTFEKAKQKVREAVKRLAFDLVELYAKRSLQQGYAFAPHGDDYATFEDQFPFDETPDQLRAIGDTLKDMESGKVMDRLVCGDVGFGKTEVAMRAAFQAVSNGKQVAVLVPTTILAFQHEQSFKARMKGYPFVIESVSRFKQKKDQDRILLDVAAGKVDILIGTHRLLSKDVRFNDLGLIIVDEEHRFGVEHKEKLKALKLNTHVLTLTATPIPRTLHMSLSGLRDISVMTTAPVDRLPIRTYVSAFDEAVVKRAIEFELARGGQVFFVYNRVQSIYEMANKIRELVPQATIGVGHGQMSEGELEKTMHEFYEKRTNVLVCTTIIEAGLDLPSANTMIIHQADRFGLAQLYQLRGRVGRGGSRAYCYLMVESVTTMTEDAKKRLEVIQRFVELGSGFNIASHDLEIRGGGNLLGPQQSGHIAAVGFDLYMELLEEAVREIQKKPTDPEDARAGEPEIKTPFPAYLDEKFIPDVHQRLNLYRRLSSAKTEEEVVAVEEELLDRYGAPPTEAQNLLWVIRLKQILKSVGIETITVGPEKVSVVPGPNNRLNPAKAVAKVAADPRRFALVTERAPYAPGGTQGKNAPGSKLVVTIAVASMKELCLRLESLFKELV